MIGVKIVSMSQHHYEPIHGVVVLSKSKINKNLPTLTLFRNTFYKVTLIFKIFTKSKSTEFIHLTHVYLYEMCQQCYF